MPSVKTTLAFLLGQALLTTASPVEGEVVQKRQCPGIHVFGARETTVGPGYGSSATVVNLVIAAHPGTTSEAIVYPACGGQASCGGIQYNASVVAGINAVATAVNNFHNSCPDTQLVLVGYSQVCLSFLALSLFYIKPDAYELYERAAKFLMMRFVEEVTPAKDIPTLLFRYLQEQSLLLRPPSLWEILEIFTDCHTTSEPALLRV